jgi:hypothetical protein
MEAMLTEANNNKARASFVQDANQINPFSKLSRYGTTIERSLQSPTRTPMPPAAGQTEGTVPPPVSIEVDVSGVSRREAKRNGFVW